jgi:protoporphyrinogen oxidase
MAERIASLGGEIKLNCEFDFGKQNLKKYERVIVTTPAPIAEKITGMRVMPKIDYLWAQTLVLELNVSFMSEYWLNILEKDWPFLVVVEHTRFMSKSDYGGKNILYLGNYLEPDSPQLKMTKEELVKSYAPFLKRITPNFSLKSITDSYLFRANYAQPVFPINYSEQLKNINKQKNKIWFANMSMVYPYDRGTNYAVAIGKEVANLCLS